MSDVSGTRRVGIGQCSLWNSRPSTLALQQFQMNASASFVGAMAAPRIVRVTVPVDYTFTVWG